MGGEKRLRNPEKHCFIRFNLVSQLSGIHLSLSGALPGVCVSVRGRKLPGPSEQERLHKESQQAAPKGKHGSCHSQNGSLSSLCYSLKLCNGAISMRVV